MNYYQRIFAGISFLAVATISSAQISYTDEGLTIGGSRGEGMGDRMVVRDAKGLFWQNGNDNVAFDLTHSSVPIISPSTSLVDFMSPSGPGVYVAFYCRSVFQEYRPLCVTSGRMSEQVSAVEALNTLNVIDTSSDAQSFTPILVSDQGDGSVDLSSVVRTLMDAVIELEGRVSEQQQVIERLRNSKASSSNQQIL